MSRSQFSVALVFVVLIVGAQGSRGIFRAIPEFPRNLINIGIGKVEGAMKLIPSPAELMETAKKTVIGYPELLVSTVVNNVCSLALSSKRIESRVTPDLKKINLQLRTACNRYTYPLLKANDMWRSPDFDIKNKVVILATGWIQTIDSSHTIDVLAKAYNCRGDVNFVALDAADYVDTLYTWAVLNTDVIGASLAVGLEQLVRVVPLENIHLIGHGLGAHIVGAAGREFRERTGKQLPRITGLDPAKPCFNEGQEQMGLVRNDAKFVDIIHSNPGVFGKRESMGDVDFYPGGLDPIPNGCLGSICAHLRSYEYYAESVYSGNEFSFMGVRCTSLMALTRNLCAGPEVPMGYATPNDVKGNYFLEVNSEKPYGKRSAATQMEALANCGVCTFQESQKLASSDDVTKNFNFRKKFFFRKN